MNVVLNLENVSIPLHALNIVAFNWIAGYVDKYHTQLDR